MIKVENLFSSSSELIQGLKLVHPEVFYDQRGYFLESWNQKVFNTKIDPSIDFFQDNHSCSTQGTLRGLHYQLPPHEQAKLVRCIKGEIFDVAIDLRRSSNTFGKWASVYLSAENFNQLFIPAGFAHGFLTLSDKAEVLYKATNYWNKDAERSILWNDPFLKIDWPRNIEFQLSDKDALAPSFKDLTEGDLFD